MSRSCIRHLRSAYQSGQLSVEDVWHLFVNRIQADRSAYAAGLSISSLNVSPTNAFVSTVNSTTPPLATIDSTAQHKQLPFLHGIPIGVKDNFCTDFDTFGVPTTCASKALSAFASVYNAAVVDHLLEAGALLLGKTNMDEFAMGCGSTDGAVSGPVVNPWSCTNCHRDAAHIAGGSSGGSAAAVAAGLCVAALASDTGGSARLPAGFCGIVGLKPTYSLLSRHGLIPLVNSLDVPALMAGSAADVGVLLSRCLRAGSGGSAATRHSDATCYPLKSGQRTKLLEGLEQVSMGDMQSLYKRPIRIGIPVEYHAPGLTREVAEVWDRVAGWLQDELAFSVETVRLPHTPMATTVYSVLCAVEVASNMTRYDGLRYGFRATSSSPGGGDPAAGSDALFAATRSQGFGEVVRSRIFAGNYFLLREQQRAGGHLDMARRLWRLIKEDFDCVFNQVDLLLTPVTLGTAPRMAEFRQFDNRTRTTLDDVCTVAVNLAGLPAVAFPVTLSASVGLPIGLQLIGPDLAEPDLLALADWITERAGFKPLVDVKQLLTAC